MLKMVVPVAAAAALIAAGTAQSGTQSVAQAVVACVYDSTHCASGSLGLAPGESVTLTKQQLADVCKDGGYAAIGTTNEGRCVNFVEHALPDGVTVTGAGTGSDEGLRDGNGGLIANIYSDGNGGLIANLYSDGNGGLIAN